jgi:nucleolar protein 12
VDEMLAIDIKKLKLAKRPLRVQRCKTLPTPPLKTRKGSSTSTATANKSGASSSKVKPKTLYSKSTPMPKGNPLLGEKIKDLSKDERKVAKATDAERQARRMAKKKLKAAGAVRVDKEKGAVKLGGEKKSKKFDPSKKAAKKGRARSDNAVSKMKGSRV